MANQKGAPKFLNCRSLLCKRALRFPDSDPFDLQVLRCSTYYLPTSTCWSRLLSKIQIILESPAAVKIISLFKCVDRRSQLKWPQRFPLQLGVLPHWTIIPLFVTDPLSIKAFLIWICIAILCKYCNRTISIKSVTNNIKE